MDRHDYEAVKPWLIEYVKTMPIPLLINEKFPRFKEDFYRNPKELYRASENETRIWAKGTMNPPWATVERLSHVPLDKQKEYIKEYGRCNLAGEARFYCSNYFPAACIECLTNGFVKDINQNKTVTLSAWTVNKPLVLAQVVFSKNKLSEIRHFNPELYADRIKFTES